MAHITAPGKSVRKSRLSLLLSAGVLSILLGCGGGGGGTSGGGGGGVGVTGACGSAAGSTAQVLCGNVFRAGTTNSPVPGATVTLLTAAGSPVGTPTTVQADGSFKFTTVPSTASRFRVDAAAGSGFFGQTAQFSAKVYAYYLPAASGAGVCAMPVGTLAAGDTKLADTFLYSESAGPPPPPSNPCPN